MPTQTTVREKVGRGSMRDIAEPLADWKAERREEIPAKTKRLIDGYQNLSPMDREIFRMETHLKEVTKKERRRRGRS